MPAYPGVQTLLVVNDVVDVTNIDSKGQPASTPAVVELPGCHLSPQTGDEQTGATTDYSKIVWRILAPPLPAALSIKSSTTLWYVDNGELAGKTLRNTWTQPDGSTVEVAEFNVETSWPHYVDGLPQQVSAIAKSEVG